MQELVTHERLTDHTRLGTRPIHEFSELTISENRVRSNICSYTAHNVAGWFFGSHKSWLTQVNTQCTVHTPWESSLLELRTWNKVPSPTGPLHNLLHSDVKSRDSLVRPLATGQNILLAMDVYQVTKLVKNVISIPIQKVPNENQIASFAI